MVIIGMARIPFLALVSTSLLLGACSETPPASGQFRHQYVATNNAVYESYRTSLESSGLLSSASDAVAAHYNLPRDIVVSAEECGVTNAMYLPDIPAIVLCYEIIADIDARFGGLQLADDQHSFGLTNAVRFIYLHEMGHALIHQLNLPTTGREEDAVDQFAALLIIVSGAGPTALDGAAWFRMKSQGQRGPLAFWDEHSFDDQRYYNLVCWVYGSDPINHAELAKALGLPAERAVRCPEEYQRMHDAWDRLLVPHEAEPN